MNVPEFEFVESSWSIVPPSIETYRIEYADPSTPTQLYSNVELTAMVDFVINWKAKSGWESVKELRIKRDVYPSDEASASIKSTYTEGITSIPISFAEGTISTKLVGVNFKDAQTNGMDGIGYNKFSIEYTTDSTNWLTAIGINNLNINLGVNDVVIALESKKFNNIPFKPLVNTDSDPIKSDFVNKPYYLYPDFLNRKADTSLYLYSLADVLARVNYAKLRFLLAGEGSSKVIIQIQGDRYLNETGTITTDKSGAAQFDMILPTAGASSSGTTDPYIILGKLSSDGNTVEKVLVVEETSIGDRTVKLVNFGDINNPNVYKSMKMYYFTIPQISDLECQTAPYPYSTSCISEPGGLEFPNTTVRINRGQIGKKYKLTSPKTGNGTCIRDGVDFSQWIKLPGSNDEYIVKSSCYTPCIRIPKTRDERTTYCKNRLGTCWKSNEDKNIPTDNAYTPHPALNYQTGDDTSCPTMRVMNCDADSDLQECLPCGWGTKVSSCATAAPSATSFNGIETEPGKSSSATNKCVPTSDRTTPVTCPANCYNRSWTPSDGACKNSTVRYVNYTDTSTAPSGVTRTCPGSPNQPSPSEKPDYSCGKCVRNSNTAFCGFATEQNDGDACKYECETVRNNSPNRSDTTCNATTGKSGYGSKITDPPAYACSWVPS